jgi:signal transduction histidine kinase
MSGNLIGKNENLSSVNSEIVTGGVSLAGLLKQETCPLQSLNLHWNFIRLKGAEVLCDSLRFNKTLTDLNLSYNAIGQAAANVSHDFFSPLHSLRDKLCIL